MVPILGALKIIAMRLPVRASFLLLHVMVSGMLIPSTRGQFFVRSTEQDVKEGAEAAKMIEEQIGLYSLPRAGEYLREVGSRIADAVNDPRWTFTFHIADQAEPNAFSIPGGGVYVSRGLLALLEREDELAGVLAHEIIHVTQRHSAREQRKGFLPGLLSVPGKVVSGVVSENLGSLINTPIEAVGGAWVSHYSRGQESESDRLGIRACAKAGYDPGALAQILARIDRAVKSESGQERKFSIFDSHPMTETRLRDIQKRSAGLSPEAKSPIAPDRGSLLAKLDGMWWGENPDQGIFQKEQFLQPVLAFTLSLPPGWKHRNTPRYLISAHPQKEALLLLGVLGPESDPEKIGEQFVSQMRTKARLEPASARGSSIGKYPAYVATYLDRSGRGPVYLHFVWVAMNGKTYQLIGLAPERDQETLRSAALTLRPMSGAELAAITGKRLRTASALPRENLADLTLRTGNVWSPDYTALVNELGAGAVLDQGQLLKIAREERWSPSIQPDH